MWMRRQNLACAEEVRMEHLPGADPLRLMVSKVDEDELVSHGKFGMAIPHLQMPLPLIYPVNAVSYDAAAVAAKKGKQNMERAQREREEARRAPKVSESTHANIAMENTWGWAHLRAPTGTNNRLARWLTHPALAPTLLHPVS